MFSSKLVTKYQIGFPFSKTWFLTPTQVSSFHSCFDLLSKKQENITESHSPLDDAKNPLKEYLDKQLVQSNATLDVDPLHRKSPFAKDSVLPYMDKQRQAKLKQQEEENKPKGTFAASFKKPSFQKDFPQFVEEKHHKPKSLRHIAHESNKKEEKRLSREQGQKQNYLRPDSKGEDSNTNEMVLAGPFEGVKTVLTDEQREDLNSRLSLKRIEESLLPYKSDKNIEALKRGELIPKELSDRMYVQHSHETGDLQIYDVEDPYWIKLTFSMLSPQDELEKAAREKALKNLSPDCDEFFEQNNLPFTLDNIHSLLEVQTFHRKDSEAIRLMQRVIDAQITPTIETFEKLLQVFAMTSNISAAFYYLKLMVEKFDLIPTVPAYNSLIFALSNIAKVHQAFDVMESMRSYGLPMEISTHNLLLRACLKAGDLRKAEDHFFLIGSEYGLDPNLDSFNLMIDCAARQKNPELAYKRFMEMQENYQLEPSRISYSSLLKAHMYDRTAQDKIPDILEQMELRGFKPDSYVFNMLMHICARYGDVSKAHRYLELMTEKGVAPDAVTYNTMLNCYAVNQASTPNRHKVNIETSLALYEQMQERNVTVSAYTLNAILKLYTTAVNVRYAEDFLAKEFKKHNIQPTKHTHNLMIDMYLARHRLDKAMDSYEKSLVLAPNYTGFKNIAVYMAKEGDHDSSHQFLLEQYDKHKLKLDNFDMIQYKNLIKNTKAKAVGLKKLETMDFAPLQSDQTKDLEVASTPQEQGLSMVKQFLTVDRIFDSDADELLSKELEKKTKRIQPVLQHKSQSHKQHETRKSHSRPQQQHENSYKTKHDQAHEMALRLLELDSKRKEEGNTTATPQEGYQAPLRPRPMQRSEPSQQRSSQRQSSPQRRSPSGRNSRSSGPNRHSRHDQAHDLAKQMLGLE